MEKLGTLINIGARKLGRLKYVFWKCEKCELEYPVIAGDIYCNGRVIETCPFCKGGK